MIVIDTHVIIWWMKNPSELSTKARKEIAISEKKKEIFISTISAWEIALLVKKGKINLGIDVDKWIELLTRIPAIHFIHVDNEIAVKSVYLPNYPNKDPADRIIVATALNLGAKLITSDRRILSYSKVQTVW